MLRTTAPLIGALDGWENNRPSTEPLKYCSHAATLGSCMKSAERIPSQTGLIGSGTLEREHASFRG